MPLPELREWGQITYERYSSLILSTMPVEHFLSTSYLSPLLAAAIAALIFTFIRYETRRSRHATQRVPGEDLRCIEWSPVHFTYPKITPCIEKLADIKPIPYRPFRWGPYHITMGIRSMAWDDWIELDNQYEQYQRIRAHRIQTRGQGVIRVLGDNPGLVCGGGEAAVELVHELAEYLSQRYPTAFCVTRRALDDRRKSLYGWYGVPPIQDITIVAMGITYRLPLHEHDGERAAERALEISALLVQDDLAIMIEGKDGKYYFQAGAICVAGFWRMEDKIGRALDEIHISGNVPRYQEKLQTSLERFFRRLPVDKPVIRNNYFIQVVQPRGEESGIDPEELAWSTTTNGLEDEYSNGQRFSLPKRDMKPTAETLRLRTERQTLRRLPISGAIVFTIRTYVIPVEELGKERGVPGRMASALRSWPDDIVEYKGRERGGWGKMLIEYMDKCHKEQIERGEVVEGGKEGSNSRYPL
ncbi:hypothetical protein AMATHDRAFT_74037 [Amanita thiersii Skay4041]|uniref:Uncharacterized protein n=1 Tax=Amanita thiersii Skay4041 TaxID=703135 RepID=A0A2A9NW45_9AGAR|nr:hypothetical protein AMATHDRAFT_74037 [Amanita thiersii Skay4041]